MVDFKSILEDARQLPEAERVRLITALWDSVPEDADLPLHPDWAPELKRRVTEIQSGIAETISWQTIREAALARIRHGNTD